MSDLRTAPERATTIEQTSKRYKLMQLLGALAVAAGVVVMIAAANAGGATEGATAIAMLLVFGGAGAYVWGRVAAWWHHG